MREDSLMGRRVSGTESREVGEMKVIGCVYGSQWKWLTSIRDQAAVIHVYIQLIAKLSMITTFLNTTDLWLSICSIRK